MGSELIGAARSREGPKVLRDGGGRCGVQGHETRHWLREWLSARY